MRKCCANLKEHATEIINCEKRKKKKERKKRRGKTKKERKKNHTKSKKFCRICKEEFNEEFNEDKNYQKVCDHCHYAIEVLRIAYII